MEAMKLDAKAGDITKNPVPKLELTRSDLKELGNFTT